MGNTEHNPNSILFIIVTRIGDTLFTTPAIRAAAERYPNAEITVLAHPKRAEVLLNIPFINKVGIIEKHRAFFMGYFLKNKYDLAIVYGYDESLLTYALRASRKVVAFFQNNITIDSLLYKAVKEPILHSEHLVRHALRLTNSLNMPTNNLRIAYTVTEEEKNDAINYLHNTGLSGSTPLIGIQSTSFPTKAWRNWPIDNFIELCKSIKGKCPDAGFALFGGPGDKQTTSILREEIGTHAIDLAGLPLRTNGAIMSLLDAYIGVDTGPTHIMSSFNIPFIGLYHCLVPHMIVGPLEHPKDFSIELPDSMGICDESTPISEITVTSVLKQLQKALSHSTTCTNNF